jgi:hypothetical protein
MAMYRKYYDISVITNGERVGASICLVAQINPRRSITSTLHTRGQKKRTIEM